MCAKNRILDKKKTPPLLLIRFCITCIVLYADSIAFGNMYNIYMCFNHVILLYLAILCCISLHCVVLNCAILCYIILYFMKTSALVGWTGHLGPTLGLSGAMLDRNVPSKEDSCIFR